MIGTEGKCVKQQKARPIQLSFIQIQLVARIGRIPNFSLRRSTLFRLSSSYLALASLSLSIGTDSDSIMVN